MCPGARLTTHRAAYSRSTRPPTRSPPEKGRKPLAAGSLRRSPNDERLRERERERDSELRGRETGRGQLRSPERWGSRASSLAASSSHRGTLRHPFPHSASNVVFGSPLRFPAGVSALELASLRRV
uniref:Uncharacterized protein n=1 Tax=Oryza brachyantha TaxID=4533 RepID=J3M0Z2_ORYBR